MGSIGFLGQVSDILASPWGFVLMCTWLFDIRGGQSLRAGVDAKENGPLLFGSMWGVQDRGTQRAASGCFHALEDCGHVAC